MDYKKDVKQQFGKNAESYVTSPIHKDGKDLQQLLKLAKITGRKMSLILQQEEDIPQMGLPHSLKK
ncbi:hypothetical protein RCG17_27470 [Neobacillus sp. PS3-12]|uniref:hypothetical protein n=1 Tax=Neobacillus sp. PS3-12 TaxID=3070677 RepID=UPI0027E00A3B|nr:hypothetical protein [Neobacillus sp. PS3-12]WML53033.1 hypothetical protein RCG17_27470 [Neobacillus sp. PS3-12]